MSGVAMTSVICNVVKEFIPADYRGGIYVGAAGGALVAFFVSSYLDRLYDSSSNKEADVVCTREIVIIAKGALVTFCTFTGGVIGFIPYIKNS